MLKITELIKNSTDICSKNGIYPIHALRKLFMWRNIFLLFISFSSTQNIKMDHFLNSYEFFYLMISLSHFYLSFKYKNFSFSK